MLSLFTSILKIVLGSLVASYFQNVGAGGWYAGVILLITSISGICSFTGFLLVMNAFISFVATMACVYAVIVDSMLARYFSNLIDQCDFSDDHLECSCPATSRDYDNLVFYLGQNAQCNNVFSRNPQLLIINAVLSVVCFLSSFLISFLLCSALGWTWMKKGNSPAVRDFTILIEETQHV